MIEAIIKDTKQKISILRLAVRHRFRKLEGQGEERFIFQTNHRTYIPALNHLIARWKKAERMNPVTGIILEAVVEVVALQELMTIQEGKDVLIEDRERPVVDRVSLDPHYLTLNVPLVIIKTSWAFLAENGGFIDRDDLENQIGRIIDLFADFRFIDDDLRDNHKKTLRNEIKLALFGQIYGLKQGTNQIGVTTGRMSAKENNLANSPSPIGRLSHSKPELQNIPLPRQRAQCLVCKSEEGCEHRVEHSVTKKEKPEPAPLKGFYSSILGIPYEEANKIEKTPEGLFSYVKPIHRASYSKADVEATERIYRDMRDMRVFLNEDLVELYGIMSALENDSEWFEDPDTGKLSKKVGPYTAEIQPMTRTQEGFVRIVYAKEAPGVVGRCDSLTDEKSKKAAIELAEKELRGALNQSFKTTFCSSCGSEVPYGTDVCPHCGP